MDSKRVIIIIQLTTLTAKLKSALQNNKTLLNDVCQAYSFKIQI